MRAFFKFLIDGETLSARMFLPVAAGLLTAGLLASAGLFRLTIDSDTLYKGREKPSYALTQASEPRYAEIEKLAGEQGPVLWLKAEIESRLSAVRAGGIVFPRLGEQKGVPGAQPAAANAGLERWTEDYLCPVKGWEENETQIRALVWKGVGPCSWTQQWTAGIPALSMLGFGFGLLFLVMLAVLTASAWALTFTFHNTRSAFRWLYRSRVF